MACCNSRVSRSYLNSSLTGRSTSNVCSKNATAFVLAGFTPCEKSCTAIATRGKFTSDLAQLSEKEIALLHAIAASDEDEFNPAPFAQRFHPQYFRRLSDKGLLIRAGRGRYKLYHPLFRQFLRQQE
jgi:hypothetical protein